MCYCSETCSNNCDFDTRHPSDIVRPLCSPYVNLKFLAYRLIVAIYFTVFLVVHLSRNIIGVYGLKIFIYLSDWTFILTTFYLIVAFLNGVADYAYYLHHGIYSATAFDEPPILYRLQWFLFNVCIITSLLIVTSFWPTVGIHLPPYALVENINLHALPSIILTVDFAITAVPIRFLHVVYPIAYGAVYLVFTAIYWVAGGTDPFGHTYIYGILNYDHPRVVTLVVLVEALGALVYQWVLAGLSLLRDKVARECGCMGRPDVPEELPLTELTVATITAYS